MRKEIFLLIAISAMCLCNPKPPLLKKPPLLLTGLHGMKYIPLVPYHILGLHPFLVYGSGLRPSPAVVKDVPKSELPAPYVPNYGDMEKLMGYGGLPMPYGGYGYPLVQKYELGKKINIPNTY